MNSVIAYTFSSPTCGPCKTIKPSIDELRVDFDSVQWESVNTHEDPHGYAAVFGITHVPAMVVTSNGVVVGKVVGTAMAEYYRILRQATRS